MNSAHPPEQRKADALLFELIAQLVDDRISERIATRSPSLELVDLATIGVPKRVMYREARAGNIDEAVKVERKWYAPRAAVEKWITSHRPTKADEPATEPSMSRVDAMRSRLGLRVIR